MHMGPISGRGYLGVFEVLWYQRPSATPLVGNLGSSGIWLPESICRDAALMAAGDIGPRRSTAEPESINQIAVQRRS